jgi:hypothetical protein
MRRLALVAAAAIALVPAVLGLFGNDSLAQNVPASISASAALVTADVAPTGTPMPTSTRTTPTSTATTADDHGGDRATRTTEPGDDRGSGGHGSDDGPGSD